jgi:hypothetical protein
MGRNKMTEENNHDSSKWSETVNIMGEDLLTTLNGLFHDVTASRVIVRNKKGRTLIDIPLTIGAAGLLLTLPYSLILVGAVWLTELELVVERTVADEEDSEADVAEGEPPMAAAHAAGEPMPDIEFKASAEPTPDSAEEPQQCKGVTKSGSQCKRTAREGSEYCAQHDPTA